MLSSVSAIFLDRDGTINIDNNYVHLIEDFHFIDGAIEAMQELKKMGFILVMITNQSGFSRGIFGKEQFVHLMHWMNRYLSKCNINLDGIYFCPHHPKSIVRTFKKNCNCRKPKPGMLLLAKKHLNINMSSSYIIGDQETDMLAGKMAGVGTRVLVRSGKHITNEINLSSDWTLDSLLDLPTVIKKNNNKFISYD